MPQSATFSKGKRKDFAAKNFLCPDLNYSSKKTQPTISKQDAMDSSLPLNKLSKILKPSNYWPLTSWYLWTSWWTRFLVLRSDLSNWRILTAWLGPPPVSYKLCSTSHATEIIKIMNNYSTFTKLTSFVDRKSIPYIFFPFAHIYFFLSENVIFM